MTIQEKVIKIEDLKDKLKLNERTLNYLFSLDVYDSLHIEGNTLTRSAITAFLDNGVTVHGKPFKEFMEVKNYDKAQKWIKSNLSNEMFQLTPMFIRSLHSIVARDILEDQYCGNYRDDYVFLRGTSYVPPHYEEIPKLLNELCESYNGWNFMCESRFENIIKVFRGFESIHPFFDGNGRTGRLLMNFLLLRNGYPFIWVRAEDRAEYLSSFYSFERSLEFHCNAILTTFSLLETGKWPAHITDKLTEFN